VGNDNTTLGKASLVTSIVGVALPASLAILAAVFLNGRPKEQGPSFGLCVLLFVVLELIALGCGVAARRTPTGKAGLVISGILLCVPVAGAISWLFSQ
jgi:hypothetical protein